MRKYPIVFVEREIMRLNSSGVSFPAGYLVSKAFLKTDTTRWLGNGKCVKEYEVEFLGYKKAIEELNKSGKYYIVVGDYAKKNKIFDDAYTCKQHTSQRNLELLREPTEYDEVGSTAVRQKAYMRTLIEQLEKNYLKPEVTAKDYLDTALEACKELNKKLGERTFDN